MFSNELCFVFLCDCVIELHLSADVIKFIFSVLFLADCMKRPEVKYCNFELALHEMRFFGIVDAIWPV